MRADFYLRSGQIIQVPHVDEVKYTRTDQGVVMSFSLTFINTDWKTKPIYIVPTEIVAIVRVEE